MWAGFTAWVVSAILCAQVIGASSSKAGKPVSSGNTYHVDWDAGNDTRGDGSAEHPWKTPWHADDKVHPGDTVLIHEKDDGSAYSYYPIGGGDNKARYTLAMKTDRVIWLAAPGEIVRLSNIVPWGATPPDRATTVMMAANQCTLNGFHIWGGVYVIGDENKIENCDISGGGGSNDLEAPARNDSFPCVIYLHGRMDGSDDCQGTVIRNNRIHDNQKSNQYGPRNDNSPLIMTYYEKDTLYEHNEIFSSIGPGIFNKSAPENITIRYNWFHHCRNAGVRTSEGNMEFGGKQIICQNVFTDNGVTLVKSGEYGIYVYNNVFYNSGVRHWYAGGGYHVFNNIFYANESKKFINFDEHWTTRTFQYLNHNNYYMIPGNIGSWHIGDANYKNVCGRDPTTLSAWQRCLKTAGCPIGSRETNSVDTDPQFLNTSGTFIKPEDFKRGANPKNGRGGKWPNVMGSYINGDEIIGTRQKPIKPRSTIDTPHISQYQTTQSITSKDRYGQAERGFLPH